MNYQAIGIGLSTFFSRFMPGFFALTIFTGFSAFGDLAKNVVGSLQGYGLKSELCLLFIVLIASYLVGTFLDAAGAIILDWIYDKASAQADAGELHYGLKRLRFVPFLRKVASGHDVLKKCAHRKLIEIYAIDSESIRNRGVCTYSFCHNAVRAGNAHAATEIDLIMSQSKFFRAISVLVFFTSLAVCSCLLDVFPCHRIDRIEAMGWIIVPVLFGIMYISVVQFARRLSATHICYEYFIILAQQGKLALSPTALPVTISS